MNENRISLYSHDRIVSQLFSLVGPRENLPTILMNILSNDQATVKKKLAGEESFSNDDLIQISERFHNPVLQLSISA